MNNPNSPERGAHLIGSVLLADLETVFRTVAGARGPFLRPLADGETGERRRWISFEGLMLEQHPRWSACDRSERRGMR